MEKTEMKSQLWSTKDLKSIIKSNLIALDTKHITKGYKGSSEGVKVFKSGICQVILTQTETQVFEGDIYRGDI